ncbi:MAG: class A beta-lactamase-related serine hydrolase [Acetobacteraceae bacterium]|nr:class A beta-lactamase-related serine hydrolase [Acetobacteraceae bacterium]
MKFGKRPLAAAFAVLISLSALAQEPRPVSRPEELGFSPDRLDRITKAFQGYVDNGQLPGAVILIAKDERVAYFKAFGFRDREKKMAMTTDSIFRLDAMTKPMVSVAAMTLAEEGKLDLVSNSHYGC